MSAQDAQKSQVHRATEDSTSAPKSPATRPQETPPEKDSDPQPGQRPRDDADQGSLFPPDTRVNRDDSDAGGPIEIETPT